MKNLLVIHEKDLDDNEHIVVGVADSVKNAENIIKDYYGEFEEISYEDIRDCNLEYSKVIEVNGTYKVMIWLEWFELNV